MTLFDVLNCEADDLKQRDGNLGSHVPTTNGTRGPVSVGAQFPGKENFCCASWNIEKKRRLENSPFQHWILLVNQLVLAKEQLF